MTGAWPPAPWIRPWMHNHLAMHHTSELSLAILPWIGAMSTSDSRGVNEHTVMVSQCKLVSA